MTKRKLNGVNIVAEGGVVGGLLGAARVDGTGFGFTASAKSDFSDMAHRKRV